MVLKNSALIVKGTISRAVGILAKVPSIPAALYREARSFISRNSLAIICPVLNEKKLENECCPHCLKAHLLKTADEMNLGKAIHEIVLELPEYRIGHDGYYLDGEKLVKI